MKNLLCINLFAFLLVVLVASSFLFHQSWLFVVAEYVPYPPPEEEKIPVTTLQPSEDETFMSLLEIEAEIELRKSVGFRSDIEYVEAVRSSDDVIIKELFGGMALTPNEARELEVRINLEKDGDALLDFFEKGTEFQDAFGGIYLEHAAGSEDYTAGGTLVQQLVEDHMAANDLLAILPPLQYPERLRIEMVNFSGEQLKQQFRAISNVASQHFGIRSVSIDQKNNRVNVMIAPSDIQKTSDRVVDKASLPDELATLVANPSVVVWEGDIQERLEAVRGGDSWSNTSGGSNCTLGFKVKDGDTYSMLTAGHCVEELGMSSGNDVYHDTTKIGTWSGDAMNGSSTSTGTGIDVAVLNMNDFLTAYEDINHYDYYRDIIGSTSNYVAGYWRCWTGISSGTECGVINCTSFTYQDPENDRWLIDTFSVDPSGLTGDSGAPAYRPETNSRASVTGIKRSSLSSSCTSGFDSVFSKWHNIRDYWSLTLVTGNAYLPLILK